MTGSRPTEAALVSMTNIKKAFGGVLACSGVDFDVESGEVHALLGENGAGKSTLMNILSGVITDYQGKIAVAGTVSRFHGPADAQSAGIATIHQELDLVPGLSIAENIFLGREPRTRLRTVDLATMHRLAGEHLSWIGVDLDPRRPVGGLRVGEQQLVEIAKALSLNARVLIMDEPTAALADAEVRRLHDTIRQLRQRGVGIVYISHRLEEIEAVADRATVLRNGTVAGTVDVATTSRDTIISLMVGRSVDALFGSESHSPTGPVLLEVTNLAVRRTSVLPGRTEPDGVDLTVRTGEIVGLAGLMGAGRTELLETLYGGGPPGTLTGSVRIAGRRYVPHDPRTALAYGIGFVPEDRRQSGLVLGHSVARNIVLSALRTLSTVGFVRPAAERAAVRRQIRELAIKTSSAAAAVSTLSGGNQQKVVFGRQLLSNPRLLLLDEPTRGVDIGAKAEIYQLLRGLASDGMGILLASSELPELLGVCDRILVLRRGRVVADLPGAGTSEEQILAAAMGADAAAESDPDAGTATHTPTGEPADSHTTDGEPADGTPAAAVKENP